MKISCKVVLLLVVSLSLFSCVKQPEMEEIRSIEITSIQDTSLHAAIQLLVGNPNSFEINITEGRTSLFINEIPIGEASLIEKVSLKAEAKTGMKLDAKLLIDPLFDILSTHSENTKINFSYQGNFKVSNSISETEVNTSSSKEIDMNELLTKSLYSYIQKELLSIEGIRMKGADDQKMYFSVEATLKNPFQEPLLIKKAELEYFLGSNGEKLGNYSIDNEKFIPKSGKETFMIDLGLDKQLLMGLIFSPKKYVQISGSLSVQMKNKLVTIPVSFQYPISPAQLMQSTH